ncbi:MAG: lasso peptide biosynthesis B2 protein [Pseudonocardia sp.]
MILELLWRLRGLVVRPFHMGLIVVVGLVVEIGLRCSTVPRISRRLGIRLDTSSNSAPSSGISEVGQLPGWVLGRCAAVDMVFRRWPFDNTCLRRALVLGQRLRRLDPVLVIGVRHDDAGRLAAHAWLTVRGVALDPLASQFAALGSIAGR